MTLMAEGIWGCTVLSANAGENDKQVMQVQINVRLDDGPSAGRQTTYQDEVNARSALYVGRSCKAIGWKGHDLATLKADVEAWIAKTGGKSTAEIKHLEIKNGKRAGEFWDKCSSIGRGAKPLSAPKAETLNDANEAMRRAMAEDGGGVSEHPADAPRGSFIEEGQLNPQKIDDDLPFATCSAVSLGEVARVLRGAL